MNIFATIPTNISPTKDTFRTGVDFTFCSLIRAHPFLGESLIPKNSAYGPDGLAVLPIPLDKRLVILIFYVYRLTKRLINIAVFFIFLFSNSISIRREKRGNKG